MFSFDHIKANELRYFYDCRQRFDLIIIQAPEAVTVRNGGETALMFDEWSSGTCWGVTKLVTNNLVSLSQVGGLNETQTNKKKTNLAKHLDN